MGKVLTAGCFHPCDLDLTNLGPRKRTTPAGIPAAQFHVSRIMKALVHMQRHIP